MFKRMSKQERIDRYMAQRTAEGKTGAGATPEWQAQYYKWHRQRENRKALVAALGIVWEISKWCLYGWIGYWLISTAVMARKALEIYLSTHGS